MVVGTADNSVSSMAHLLYVLVFSINVESSAYSKVKSFLENLPEHKNELGFADVFCGLSAYC